MCFLLRLDDEAIREIACGNGNPHDVPATLAELLESIQVLVRRYVVVTDVQATAVALWVVHTHMLDAFDCTPYLSVTSADKQSGKTRLLEVLDLVVARPWFTGRVTAAVLVRKIDGERPTLLLDESDAAFNAEKEYAEALRGVLNTGFKRNGKSSMCVGQGAAISYKDFSTFCPKAIAGIGNLPDTVADRSILIRLQRRAPRERVERFRERLVREEAGPLREALQTFAQTEIDRLCDARPSLPEELSDRAADVWEPLLALADHAGGQWPAEAKAAALALSGRGTRDDESAGIMLLSDIRNVFDGLRVEHPDDPEKQDRIASKTLVEELIADPEAPWVEWVGGKEITQRGVAKILARYDVKSRTIRAGATTMKGYHRAQFDQPWERYLPPVQAPPKPAPSPLSPDSSVTSVTTASLSQKEGVSHPSQDFGVTDSEMPANPHGYADVTAVTDECPFTEENGGKELPHPRADRPLRGGSIIPGEPGFLAFIRDRYRGGHLTASEWLARAGTYGMCLHGGA